jgi:GxxExxY protein
MDHPKLLFEQLCYKIIGCIYDVRNTYGSGQKEIVYQNALAEILSSKGILYLQEVPISIKSQLTGKTLGKYRLDFVVDQKNNY